MLKGISTSREGDIDDGRGWKKVGVVGNGKMVKKKGMDVRRGWERGFKNRGIWVVGGGG